MLASRSRLSSNFKQLRMLSHRNGIVLLYFLFTLLYSIANLKYKDLVRKQLKGALNAKAVNASDGAAKMFLRNLYKNYFHKPDRQKQQLQLFQKPFILCKD